MSTIYGELDIEVVKITLAHKVTGATVDYSFSEDYWAAGALYTTNPAVYPLLAGPVQVHRGVDRFAGIKFSVSIQIHGDSHLAEHGKSFVDVLQTYEIHNAPVVIYYYPKTLSGLATHSDANNTRQTLRCVVGGFDSGGQGGTGIITLQCIDVWFKNREISKLIDGSALTNLDYKYYGEYGSIVFGQSTVSGDGIPIDAPIFDSKLEGSPERPTMKLFGGWTYPDHPLKAFKRLLVKNQDRNQDSNEWLEVTLPADPQTAVEGVASTSGATADSLAAYWRAVVYQPPTHAEIISLVRFLTIPQGSVSSDTGVMTCAISDAQYQPTSDTYAPVGGALRSESKDPMNAALLVGSADFMLSQPLPLSHSGEYFITQEWSNTTDTTNYMTTYYRASGGSTHYSRDNSQNDKGWTKQANVRLEHELYAIGDGDDAWKDSTTSGTNRYSYYHLEGKSAYIDAAESRKLIDNGLEFKLCVSGLKDDGSGTYTGSASAVIEKPQHIIKFVLMNSNFLGLTSTDVDTSSISTAVTDMDAAYVNSLKMQVVINSQTYAEEFILEICRQARLVFYKTRVGKLALKFPRYSSTPDAGFSEAWHRGDFILESYADNDYSTVINDFRQGYKPDIVNQPNDPALARRDPRVKLANEILLNDTESTAGNTDRVAKCLLSQTLYGKRPHTAALDYYDSSTYAQVVQDYYCDRFTALQKRARFRIPRRTYYATLDLFSNIRLEHTAIPSADGSAYKLNEHYQGTMITNYYEGVPVLKWLGGVLGGQVMEVEESGPWMTLTIETVSGYL